MKLWLRNAILRLTTEYTGIHRCPIIRKLVHEGDWENRERSASLRQDRCCEVEPKPLPLAFLPRRGAGDEAESEDLPVESAYLVLRTKEQYVPRRCGRRGFIAVNPEARLQTDRRSMISRCRPSRYASVFPNKPRIQRNLIHRTCWTLIPRVLFFFCGLRAVPMPQVDVSPCFVCGRPRNLIQQTTKGGRSLWHVLLSPGTSTLARAPWKT